jgi:hypothetical protein
MPDDDPSGVQTVTQSNSPWAGQQPFLEDFFSRSQELSNTPLEQYPQSRVVGFSNQTNDALQMGEDRARNGSALQRQGQQTMQDVAGGNYLGSNPAFNNAFNAAARPVIDNFNERIMPNINAGMSASGRYGSGAHSRLAGQATNDLTRNLSDMAGTMSYQNYSDERGRQMQAAAMAPQMAMADYNDIGQLQQIGGIREAQAGAELQDDIDRFNFQQMEPRNRLSQYGTQVAGGSFGGSMTQNNPIYRNKTNEALGTASTVAGIAGSLFGQGGVFSGMGG